LEIDNILEEEFFLLTSYSPLLTKEGPGVVGLVYQHYFFLWKLSKYANELLNCSEVKISRDNDPLIPSLSRRRNFLAAEYKLTPKWIIFRFF
jgi:hypothetical protein